MGIPKISNSKLEELVKRIKPVMRCASTTYSGQTHIEPHEDGDLYYMEPVDPRGVAFTWDPKPTERTPPMIELDKIYTDHSYGYVGFFKPSIAEVLAQIPEQYINQAAAFETHYSGESGEYHSAQTILYRLKSLNEIDQELEHLQHEKEKMSNNYNN